MKRFIVAVVVLLAFMFSLSTPSVIAQQVDYCDGDFDNDGDQDGSDAAKFKSDFGRSMFSDPCPVKPQAKVPKTGQTTSYATGDDGDLEKGVEWPNPRFTDNGDGTVTDNLTGLIWLKDANCFDLRTWDEALSECNGLSSGTCGLTDGSNSGDWRLPNSNELASLVHKDYYGPAIPNTAGTGQWSEGDPFTNVKPDGYCSSGTIAFDSVLGGLVHMDIGGVGFGPKTSLFYVWPVRDPQ